MEKMIKVDFHVHSIASKDSLSKGEKLLARAKELGLGKLILTDHNTTAGAVELQKEYPDFVIVGEEILTIKGEILAVFVKFRCPILMRICVMDGRKTRWRNICPGWMPSR